VSITGGAELIAERRRFVETMESLSDEEFETGRTLCAGWAPRDVLAHVLGVDRPAAYARFAGRVNAANAAIVAQARARTRDELLQAAREWATHPSASARAAAHFLVGDVAMHHQDVLRGLGRTREIPTDAAAAMFREGIVLSTGTKRNLLRYKVIPSTVGGFRIGRGRPVQGTTEALALWLAGRKGLDGELRFY
jgi:uncharacterized protein (TIGR03083 family)